MNGDDDQMKIKKEFKQKKEEPSGFEIIEYLERKGCDVKRKGEAKEH